MEHNREFHTVEASLLPFHWAVLVRDVARHWLMILTLSLAVGLGAYGMTELRHRPVYTASAAAAVSGHAGFSTAYGDLSVNTGLAQALAELMNSPLMQRTVLAEAGLEDFGGTVSASVIPETNLLTLEVTDRDPERALLACRAILDGHGTLTGAVVGDLTLEVLQNPVPPAAPSDPANAGNAMLRAMLLTAGALCLGLACLSYSRDTVRSGTEARRKLRCRYLGEIPHERKRHRIRVTDPGTGFRFRESIRRLRHRVERCMDGKRVLMVTSLLENEGKSTVAENLARSLARKHSRVLYVEWDCGDSAGGTVPEQEENSGLYMLKKPADMGELIGRAKENYDYVVLELPAMAVAADAEGIMELADAGLLVVRQNGAKAGELNRAIAALEKGRAELIGCVLNDTVSVGSRK